MNNKNTKNAMNNTRNLTKRIALSGVCAAMCVVLLYIAGFTVADLSALAVCAVVTMVILVECGAKFAWLYAAVTSVLALILLPSKLYAIEYIMLSAVYPILKMYFERLRPLFAYPVKISCLDTMLLVLIILAEKVFVSSDGFFPLTWVTIIAGSAFFIVYDLALSACVTLYIVKIRTKIGLRKK